MHGTVVFVLLICLSEVHSAPIKIRMKDFEKWLVPILMGKNIMKIGCVELDLAEINFESSFLEVYNSVIDFIDGNLSPPTHFRLIFNKNIIRCITEVIFPARYKAFLADAVEGNTVLYMMQCLIQRWIYRDSSLDNPEIPRCWRKLNSDIYRTNSESHKLYKVKDQELKISCRQFFDKWYPDVSWDLLPDWEISLNPSQFLQDRLLSQISSKRPYPSARNFEDSAMKFYACSREKVNFIQDVRTRFCYQITLDMNMHLFLGDFLWKFKTEYDKLKDLFIELAPKDANIDQEYHMTIRTSFTRPYDYRQHRQHDILDNKTGFGATTLTAIEDRKRVKKDSDAITIIKTKDESIAYQRKANIFVGVSIFIGCVILAVIITKIILCCKDFRAFYRPDPEPLEQDFKSIEENLKKGKSNLKFMKTRLSQKGRKKITHKMKSMSDATLPTTAELLPLPDETDPLIRTSFNNPNQPETPKKKK